ncbi:hypothetical protein AXK58_24255 [Tsukamurella tyrosinosolvens]|uniref:Uncharacterized protein n=1 Tax=Tsukamurella tyrosinosolvens TaxID=57704 RepID=A0A1H4UPG5_TSUTY|nr:hypothetical protein [Tsukamurella tyrosinosolvens]KXO99070.1 hypothetical protein AXK58_24255 [Tsukamurella tyrosinosolvens]SEC70014.1 hypothetical protein SAMN04489793_2955 [Tsukamurella tyrosinosolvens]
MTTFGPNSTVEFRNGDDVVNVTFTWSDKDGAIVFFLNTDEMSSDRPLRVNVNDGPVFSARPEHGDHDFDYVGEYLSELNRAR